MNSGWSDFSSWSTKWTEHTVWRTILVASGRECKLREFFESIPIIIEAASRPLSWGKLRLLSQMSLGLAILVDRDQKMKRNYLVTSERSIES
jgi:hypothetical protein